MKRTISIRILSLLLAGAATLPLTAQRAYTLDECVEQALQNNVRMKNAGNSLEDARQQRKAAFTKYFPTVSASGAGFLSSTPMLGMELAPGMGIGLMKNGLLGGVTASMPLFAGGQIINGNKLAEVNVEKYRLLQRQDENTVRLTAEQYYWQIVMLKEKLKTLDVITTQLAGMAKDVDAAVSAGITNRNDLLQVQLKQNDTRSSRLNLENALSLSRRLLAQYMGLDTLEADVASAVGDSLPPSPMTLYASPSESLPLTPEYNLLQTKLKASHIEHRLTIGKRLPTVAVGGGFLYDNLMGRDRTYWAGGLTVSIPLSGWWEGSHDIKRSRLAMETDCNNLEDGSQLLMLNMRSAWNDMTDAYEQIKIAAQSIEQATENLRLQTDYYHAGTCTMSDLLEAQSLYQQSRDKYVESYAQYEIKKRQYLQATGR